MSVPSNYLDSFESSHKKSFLEKEEFDVHESVYSSWASDYLESIFHQRKQAKIQKDKDLRIINPLIYNKLSYMVEEHAPGAKDLVMKETYNFFPQIDQINFAENTKF